MSSSSSATFALIPIFHGLRVIKYSKTSIAEPSPRYGSTTPTDILYLRVCTRPCRSSPDRPYQYRADFDRATWSLFPKHHFRRRAKLTSIFLVIPFHLKQRT